jgi:hypothetical protein
VQREQSTQASIDSEVEGGQSARGRAKKSYCCRQQTTTTTTTAPTHECVMLQYPVVVLIGILTRNGVVED